MFNSQMLDAAIGLVFVYFFLSLLCSVIIEMVTGLTKKRPRMLSEGIFLLLQDSKALDKLYEQPLFIGNSTPKNLFISLWESFLPLPSKKKRVPSYISSRSFVLSLLESLKRHPDIVKKLLKDKISPPGNKDQIKEFENKLNSLPDDSNIKKALLPLLQSAASDPDKAFKNVNEWYNKTIQEPKILEGILKEIKIPTIGDLPNVRSLVDSLPDDNAIKKALIPLLDSAGGSLDKAIDNMEKWYDEAMDRVTGWYKRYSQVFALILAFVIALLLNADTFEIGKAIYRDQAVRDSLVAMAKDEVKKQEQLSSDVMKGIQGEQPKAAGTFPASSTQEPGKGEQGAGIASPPVDSKKPLAEKGSTPNAVSQTTEPGESAPEKKSSSSAPEKTDLEKKVEQVKEDFMQISSINLPIGWPLTKDGWPDIPKILGYHKDQEGKVIPAPPRLLTPVKLLGILLTALMVSLGANFWFELLNKLLNIRNAGKKPLSKEEQEARKK